MCFIPTCASFVPRTKAEMFVTLAASPGRFGVNVFMLCFRMTVSGPESEN